MLIESQLPNKKDKVEYFCDPEHPNRAMILQTQVFEPYFTVSSDQENSINQENHWSFYHWERNEQIFIMLILRKIDFYDAIQTFLFWHHYYLIIISY